MKDIYKQEGLQSIRIENFCKMQKIRVKQLQNLVNNIESMKILINEHSTYFSLFYHHIKESNYISLTIDGLCRPPESMKYYLYERNFSNKVIKEVPKSIIILKEDYGINHSDLDKHYTIFATIFSNEELLKLLIRNYKKFLMTETLYKGSSEEYDTI